MARSSGTLGDASDVGGASDSSNLRAAVAAIIARILGVARIDERANFYELGGNSLQALGVLAEIRETLGVELPIDVLFEKELSAASLAADVAARRDSPRGI